MSETREGPPTGVRIPLPEDRDEVLIGAQQTAGKAADRDVPSVPSIPKGEAESFRRLLREQLLDEFWEVPG